MIRLFPALLSAFTFAIGLAAGMMLVPAPEAGNGHSHDHSGKLELAAGEDAPAFDFNLTKDPASGWNIELHLANFTFAPERASTAHVPGEGHGHIYVNETKIARLYGNWFHLSDVKSGDLVTITLNSNDHSEITVGGAKLSVTRTIP